MLENNLQEQLEEKKAEEQEKIRDKAIDLQRQAQTLLAQSSYLAKQLTQDIISAVADLVRTTYQEIDFEDYFITILQTFQQIPEYLEEPNINRNKFLRPEQVAITYKKRGRM